jgi:quercetin dioxygenase-like cupin family protein
MKIVKIEPEHRPHIGTRREIRLKETPLGKASALQVSELRLDRSEDYHTNHTGYVLCFVVSGWMEAHCAGKNYKLKEGEGIVFEPGERHRINKGEGWMISISSVEYDDLSTAWEEE